MIYVFFANNNMNSEYVKMVNELVEADEYRLAYEHYGTVFDDEVNIGNVEGSVVKGFLAVAPYVEVTYKDKDDEDDDLVIDKEYILVEKTLDLVFFDVPSTFSSNVKSLDDAKGGVKITFDTGETFFAPFYSKYFNKYDHYNNFNFLPVSIYEKDILETLNVTVVPTITKIELIDESEDVELTIATSITNQFNNSFYAPFSSFETTNEDDETIITNYFERVANVNSGKFAEDLENEELSTTEINAALQIEVNEINSLLQDIIEENEYSLLDNTAFYDKLFERGSYIAKNVITIVCLVLVNGVLIFFLVIKKKKTNSYQIVKMPEKKTPTQNINMKTINEMKEAQVTEVKDDNKEEIKED